MEQHYLSHGSCTDAAKAGGVLSVSGGCFVVVLWPLHAVSVCHLGMHSWFGGSTWPLAMGKSMEYVKFLTESIGAGPDPKFPRLPSQIHFRVWGV